MKPNELEPPQRLELLRDLCGEMVELLPGGSPREILGLIRLLRNAIWRIEMDLLDTIGHELAGEPM